MRQLLADIHEESESPLARDLARYTDGCVQRNVQRHLLQRHADTQWLSIQAYADMLSGGSFRPAN